MGGQDHERERDQAAYRLAKDYLLDQYQRFCEGTPERLERYLAAPERPATLAGVYRNLLVSAQSAVMGPNVISKPIGGFNNLSSVLCGFDPEAVLKRFPNGPDEVTQAVFAQLMPHREPPTNAGNWWRRFSTSVISGAQFLSQFASAQDFYDWADALYRDERTRLALPERLAAEIKGIGFVLACDFLKELGYVEYGKPDNWMKRIFTRLQLTHSAGDREVLEAIVRVARNAHTTPYNVDKLFWLIGTGKFYLEECDTKGWPPIGTFIEHVTAELRHLGYT